jgi:hypothetical protein
MDVPRAGSKESRAKQESPVSAHSGVVSFSGGTPAEGRSRDLTVTVTELDRELQSPGAPDMWRSGSGGKQRQGLWTDVPKKVKS